MLRRNRRDRLGRFEGRIYPKVSRRSLIRRFPELKVNYTGIIAAAASVIVFFITAAMLRRRATGIRVGSLLVLSLFAIPSLLFAVYYFHVLPEQAWFYQLRAGR